MWVPTMDGRADRRLLLKGILVAGIMINAVSAPAAQGYAECVITADRQGDLFLVQAIVRSPTATSGTFRLTAIKRNGGGTSRTMQQGAFDLRQGGEQKLAATAFEASAEGHVTMSLRLDTDRGIVSCSFPE